MSDLWCTHIFNEDTFQNTLIRMLPKAKVDWIIINFHHILSFKDVQSLDDASKRLDEIEARGYPIFISATMSNNEYDQFIIRQRPDGEKIAYLLNEASLGEYNFLWQIRNLIEEQHEHIVVYDTCDDTLLKLLYLQPNINASLYLCCDESMRFMVSIRDLALCIKAKINNYTISGYKNILLLLPLTILTGLPNIVALQNTTDMRFLNVLFRRFERDIYDFRHDAFNTNTLYNLFSALATSEQQYSSHQSAFIRDNNGGDHFNADATDMDAYVSFYYNRLDLAESEIPDFVFKYLSALIDYHMYINNIITDGEIHDGIIESVFVDAPLMCSIRDVLEQLLSHTYVKRDEDRYYKVGTLDSTLNRYYPLVIKYT